MDRPAVEIVYAARDGEDAVRVTLDRGKTLRRAIEASGILARHPEIDLARAAVGVFGQVRPLDAPARPGDRIEIYRALKADPVEQRRRRATEARKARPRRRARSRSR